MEKRDDGITAARKVLQLMDILSAHNGQLTLAQLARQLDCSVSSVNRLLQTMQAAGYAEKNGVTNRYRLTNRLFTVCNSLLARNRTVTELVSLAHLLSQKYDVSVNINAMYEDEPIMLYRDTAHFNKDLDFLLGDTAPAYCSSSGKAMLSLYPREALDAYFSKVEIMSYQQRPVSAERVREDIDEAARRGYAVCAEEFVSGVFSMSFPLRDGMGDLYALTFITTMADRRRICSAEVIRAVRARVDALNVF